ncbi:DUF3644 domain-containing protein [Abiotrophia defectiva]|uniref:DUF3644 domain-containing protein n=1 Tax=Abiotrophia defectiva TaxID=46125 RepID=UPI0026EDE6D2|nr:DUF3644 domain-containing protein [Abiotrophia defectiva]
MENLSERLVDKSIEAFVMGLEIYNKPTIKYRIEGFSFFVCNAWELMLKAEIINRGQSIYYRDNPDRTLSLEASIKKIYSDENTRIRLNLERIVELRNISTHYITEDYELKYAPLFQACVLNYTNELKRFHNVDVTEKIAQNFLTISASYEPLSNEQIRLKYSSEIAEKLIRQVTEIDVLKDEYKSDKFAIEIKQNLYIVKKREDADFVVSIAKDADTPVEIIKDVKDPSTTHPISYKSVIEIVVDRLNKKNIEIVYPPGFNKYVLNLFMDFYNVKSDPKFSYAHKIGEKLQYTYSQQLVEFIVAEIKKDPQRIVESLRKSKKR